MDCEKTGAQLFTRHAQYLPVRGLARPVGRFKEYNVPVRFSGYPRVALVYPSTYQASITNLFTHTAYYFLLEKSDALVDRFTLDNPDRGLVTGARLRDFDLVLASANYELDLLYLVKLLDEAGVEPLAERRRGGPLIIVGGLAAMSNPEPFLEIANASFIGDGEILLERLARSLSLLPDRPIDFLDSLGEGLYTSEAEVRKVFVKDLDSSAHPTMLIRSKLVKPVYGEGFYLELSRGCRWLCRFCLEAYAMYPYRYRSLGVVKSLVSEGLKHVSRRRVVVYSLSPFDHPNIRDLLSHLADSGIDFSLPSIRWDTLRLDDLDLLSRSSQRTLTLAPESMSPGLSCSLGKCFSLDAFRELALAALEKGFDLKLYLMVGAPSEREEDVLETARRAKEIASYSSELGRRVSISVNPLVPKPHTPLQDHPLIAEEEYLGRIGILEKELGEGAVAHLRWLHAYVQSLIALGGRGIGRLVALLALRGLSKRNIAELSETLKVDVKFPCRRRSRGERPWSRVKFPLDEVVDKVSL